LTATFHAPLLNALHQCKIAVSVYLNYPVNNDLIEILNSALQRALVIDLVLSDSTVKKVEQNPFILKSLFQLRNKGLNIYQTDASSFFEDCSIIIQTDFKDSLLIKRDFQLEKLSKVPFKTIFEEIVNKQKNHFHTDIGSIKASFFAANNILFRGSKTDINWEVSNSENVRISGIGEVIEKSSKSVQVLEDTVLVLTASNKKQHFKKALFLKAIENMHIKYDVLFLNPASKKYVSLNTEEKNHGVFGVSRGQKIKLIWSVENAEQVQISPFNVVQNAGNHIFNIEGSIAITIQASLQDQHASERIIIHEYPMPVFTEKFVNIDSDFLSKMEFKMHHYSRKASQYLDQSQLSNAEGFNKEIYKEIKNQEKKLIALSTELSFSNFYREHSIEKMNKSVLNRLKAYFKDQPDVVKMINLLKKTNHE
jgi:hypothetical protein